MQRKLPNMSVHLQYGEQQDVKVTLPLSSGQIKSLYEKNSWEPDTDFIVSPQSFSSMYEKPNPLQYLIGIQKDVSFQKLHLFAKKFESLDKNQYNQFDSMVKRYFSDSLINNKTITLDHLLETVYTLDDCIIASNITNDKELEMLLFENDFIEELNQLVDNPLSQTFTNLLEQDYMQLNYNEIEKNHRVEFGGVFFKDGNHFMYFEPPNGLPPTCFMSM